MWVCKRALLGWTAALLTAGLFPLLAQSKLGVGRPATEAEIKAWDISIPPDGSGLPPGGGTAVEGKEVYAARCAECHGENAEGGDEAALVGGQGTLSTANPVKTVGSYWPYPTTVWDYINRSMPYDRPGMLTFDQVYAVVAYILHLEGIIEENERMDAQTLPQVKMPNRDGFVPDPRPKNTKPARE